MDLKSVLIIQIILCIYISDCHGRHYGRHRESRRVSHSESDTESGGSAKAIVRMPSGKKYKISNPKVSLNTNCDHAELVDVDPARREYQVIEREMRTQLRVNTVNKIQKIVNSCLWSRYVYYRDGIIRQTEVGANETYLFATDTGTKDLDEIPNTGYDERLSNHYPGYPTGLYFIDKIQEGYSFPTGERSFYLSRVALGNVHYLNSPREISHPPLGYQAISLAKENSPHMQYIISRGEQIYPEYRIFIEA